MSQSGLNYSIIESFGSNQKILTYYDFSGMSGRHIGNESAGGLNYGVIENCDPSVNTGVYSGIVTHSGQSTVAGAKLFTTGIFLGNDMADLSKSTLRVDTPAVKYSSLSSVVDFQFNNEVSDSVIFGSLEKISTSVDGLVVTGSRGFNFGVNDRGKLFYQSFDRGGDFIYTANSIELSRRNIVGFSVGSNTLSLSRFDYLNHNLETETFNVDSSYIGNNTEFYLGGSNQYFRGGTAGPSGEFRTSDISLNSFCLLSGYVAPSLEFSIGSGLIGSFFESQTGATTKKIITGYRQVTTFKTGITGYDYENTGSLNISTGRYMLTGGLTASSTASKFEGDVYFEYNTFEEGGVTTFNKEQVGLLHPDSGYQYVPSGDSAFSTLGLRHVESQVQNYIERKGISGSATVGVKLYGFRFQAGDLPDVSGVTQIPLFETVEDRPALKASGVRLSGPSDLFKKDYVYYKGERK